MQTKYTLMIYWMMNKAMYFKVALIATKEHMALVMVCNSFISWYWLDHNVGSVGLIMVLFY